MLLPVAVLISLYFPPESSGGSTGAWNRAMVLSKIGYSVYVISGFPAYPSGKVLDSKYKGKLFFLEIMGPFKVIRLRLLPLRHDGFLKRLVIFLNFVFLTVFYLPKISRITGNISLVYARAPILFSSFSGFIYSKITRSFFIFEAPDLWPEELVLFKTRLSSLIMGIGKILASISYKIPDMVVTVSQTAASYISSHYSTEVSVYGIPIGIDTSKFQRVSKEIAREELTRRKIFPIEIKNKFIILYSGLISEAQRVEILAHAADKLREENIAIIIVGQGPEKHNIEKLKVEYCLNNLYILPLQPRSIMPYIISAADLCTVLLAPVPILEIAVPSKFYEYLACGKPIIGICGGELKNLINSNNIGKVVQRDIKELVCAIKDLETAPSLLKKMENNCYLTLQKFSIENISSNFKYILEKEMKSKSKHPA